MPPSASAPSRAESQSRSTRRGSGDAARGSGPSISEGVDACGDGAGVPSLGALTSPTSAATARGTNLPVADGGPSSSTRAKRKARRNSGGNGKSVAGKKRAKGGQSAEKPTSQQLSLYVRWYSPTGKTKVNHLVLKPIEGVECLEGISKDLVTRAFPVDDRPDYITSEEFYRFTPDEEFMNLPGDIARTEFRLVVKHEGYEYTVLGRELGAHRDPERKMLVTVIEFESTALMIGRLGVTISLIAYPVISVKKTFLNSIRDELETNPEFKGIL
mmetsp:Transcript_31045/g.55594  ORF Transcript_31045/g.55594 Transcript_31045/m.55594 type:complete len:272 (-) Transcript_31045:259-1074(-)